MRLFVAVDIDEATRTQLTDARAAIERVLEGARVPPRVTWVKHDAAHVTLRFIGEAPESTATQIEQALRAEGLGRPFQVCWNHLGAFPNTRRPRVLWVGPQSIEKLASLADAVSARLKPLVGPDETRTFKPHVTLARVKESGAGVDWSQALAAAAWGGTTTHIDHVTLYLSRLSPKGPTYTPVCRAPL